MKNKDGSQLYATSERSNRALVSKISKKMLDEYTGNKTDSFTYSFPLKAYLNLLHPSDTRRSIVKQRVEECCAKDLMNDQALRRLVKRLPEGEVRDLLSIGIEHNLRMLRFRDLASEWSQNAGQKRRRR